MGNEFKVMEMNVLFEVQKALVEDILSHSDKWKWHCRTAPSPRLDSSNGECDVSLGTAVLQLVLRYCYCDSSLFVHAGHPNLCSLWSSCVIACVAHLRVPGRQRIDFCCIHISKANLQYSEYAADVVPSQQLPQLRTPAGYQWPDAWIFNRFFVLNLCVFMTDTVFKMCTNPFLLNCSQRRLQIDLAMILREGRRGDGVREERETQRTIRKQEGRVKKKRGKKKSENELEWDFCSSVKKGFECI